MSENSEKTTTVRLLKDGLTHDGKERKTGDSIDVNDAQLEFLQEQGFVARDGTSAKAKPAPADAK